MLRSTDLVERVGSLVPSGGYDNALTRRLVRERLLTRPALERYARDAGRYFEYGEREVVNCSTPPGAGPLPEQIHLKTGNHVIPQPFVAELPDVQLIGPNAMPLTPSGGVVFENLLGSVRRAVVTHIRTMASGIVPTYRKRAADESLDHAVSLIGPWDHEYYHWLSDYLTRLRGVKQYAKRTGETPTVIVPMKMADWMRESLALAGVSDEQCYEWDGGRLAVNRLVVPSLPRITELTYPGDRYEGYVYSPAAYRWLGCEFRSRVRGPPIDLIPSADVYVSRADAPVRRVVNEKELLETIKSIGFRRYVLSDYSMADQVRLFAGADQVIGPMGAGLTNILAAESATLLTLFGDDHNACYYTQASGLGFPFGYVRGTPVDGDMTVEPNDVLGVLATLNGTGEWGDGTGCN